MTLVATSDELADTESLGWDLPASLGTRRVPITVVQGDRDYVDPGATGWTELVRSKAPLASCVEVTVVPNAGHSSWIDDPAGVARGVRRGLSRRGC
jgi:pimeloyl-ACP methyl ester carboxylesterase